MFFPLTVAAVVVAVEAGGLRSAKTNLMESRMLDD